MIFSLKNDYHHIIESFSSIQVWWLIVGILTNIIIYHLADAIYIRYYCKRFNKKYSLIDAIKVEQTGVFFSSITPSSSGGQFAQVYVFGKQNIPTSYSASMLMLSFISWQIILVLFGLFVLIFNYNGMFRYFNIGFSVVLIGFLINFIVIVGLFLSAFSKTFHRLIFEKLIPFLSKFRIFKGLKNKEEKVENWLKMFRVEFRYLLTEPRLLWRRLLTDLFKIVVLYLAPFFAAKAIGVDIGFDKMPLVIIMSTFIYMITSLIPIPGAAGGSEAVFVLLMNMIFGAATTSVMLMWRILTYYLPMLISFLVFSNVKEIYKEEED
jgi:uncharacterized protein (TIRG00374 family)